MHRSPRTYIVCFVGINYLGNFQYAILASTLLYRCIFIDPVFTNLECHYMKRMVNEQILQMHQRKTRSPFWWIMSIWADDLQSIHSVMFKFLSISPNVVSVRWNCPHPLPVISSGARAPCLGQRWRLLFWSRLLGVPGSKKAWTSRAPFVSQSGFI